jgi:hypothetical protein
MKRIIIAAIATLSLSLIAIAPAAAADWRQCGSQYWGGGAFNVWTWRTSCHYAAAVTRGGLTRRLTTRVGGFRCTRVGYGGLQYYDCWRGSQGLTFNTY